MNDDPTDIDAVADRSTHDPRQGIRVVVKSGDAARLAASFVSRDGNWFEQGLVSANGYRMNFDTEQADEWEEPGGCGGFASVSDERFDFAGDLPRDVAGQIAGLLTGSHNAPVPLMLNCFAYEGNDYLRDPDGNPVQIPVYLVPEP